MRTVKHILHALVFLVALLMLLFRGDVGAWNSTYLDLFGQEAEGTAVFVDDCVVRYTFHSRDGQMITELRSNAPSNGTTFLYDPQRPRVFKLKGTGRTSQVLSVIFLLAFAWEVVQVFRSLRRSRPAPAETQEKFWKSC